MSKKDLRISNILIDWYNDHKRNLPWRDTQDPYVIWISEVILQQTRVDQGYEYFQRFVERFPTVNILASAEEEEVLKLWQGLGYYSRARNMHAASKMIMNSHGGDFPKEYKDVLALKGVGEYTAAAIVSFAYGAPYAVLDGNVYRVLSRLFAIDTPINTTKGKKEFSELAQALLNISNPGIHNQAIMEFGALQCVPVSPNCEICPLSTLCVSYAEGRVKELPVKEKKLKIRERYFYYFDIRYGENTFLRKRVDKDIWQNLYEFPLIEKSKAMRLEELLKDEEFRLLFSEAKNVQIREMSSVKHVLSHQVIYTSFYLVNVSSILLSDAYVSVKLETVDSFPVSRLIHKYLEQIEVNL
ncbi:A/G-specific adenine glycosylase [Dysgonomonas sp. Marseille-P4361]|uniref:A/G-specific adenine glycosylase n=1 Tax=Dysgonomonas sp. Marseille-P4361 TaxID=2161820 RepID=UPI000D550372|nr:A/G-specific adenine glycosylase [Dysgonomonas sp. Marseille-P4361]